MGVPDKVGIVGADNQIKEDYYYSRLTSIDQKFEERGSIAATMLFELIEGKKTGQEKYTTVITEPELMVRASSIKK